MCMQLMYTNLGLPIINPEGLKVTTRPCQRVLVVFTKYRSPRHLVARHGMAASFSLL